jgi:hypothetical protein
MKKVLFITLVALGSWYLYQHPEVWRQAEDMAKDVKLMDRHETLYRWTDADGVIQYTDEPPPDDIEYEIVEVDPDANVIPAEEFTGKNGSVTNSP